MGGPRHAPSAVRDPLGLVAKPLVRRLGPTGHSDPVRDERRRATVDGAKSAAVMNTLKTAVCALVGLLVVVGLVAPSSPAIDPRPSAAKSDDQWCLRTIAHFAFTSHKLSDRVLMVQR